MKAVVSVNRFAMEDTRTRIESERVSHGELWGKKAPGSKKCEYCECSETLLGNYGCIHSLFF